MMSIKLCVLFAAAAAVRNGATSASASSLAFVRRAPTLYLNRNTNLTIDQNMCHWNIEAETLCFILLLTTDRRTIRNISIFNECQHTSAWFIVPVHADMMITLDDDFVLLVKGDAVIGLHCIKRQ